MEEDIENCVDKFNLRINSFLILIVVCKRQLGGEAIHRMGQFDQWISLLLVMDNFPWEISERGLNSGLVSGLTSKGPDYEGLRVRLHNALESERFAWSTAQHWQAGQDGRGDWKTKHER